MKKKIIRTKHFIQTNTIKKRQAKAVRTWGIDDVLYGQMVIAGMRQFGASAFYRFASLPPSVFYLMCVINYVVHPHSIR